MRDPERCNLKIICGIPISASKYRFESINERKLFWKNDTIEIGMDI